ncbi:hypothetical protein KRMM14A1004_30960 [Krasilnikovia sp. MM14-A1004]
MVSDPAPKVMESPSGMIRSGAAAAAPARVRSSRALDGAAAAGTAPTPSDNPTTREPTSGTRRSGECRGMAYGSVSSGYG